MQDEKKTTTVDTTDSSIVQERTATNVFKWETNQEEEGSWF